MTKGDVPNKTGARLLLCPGLCKLLRENADLARKLSANLHVFFLSKDNGIPFSDPDFDTPTLRFRSLAFIIINREGQKCRYFGRSH